MFGRRILISFMLIAALLAIGLVPAMAQGQTELSIGFSFVIVDSLDPGVTTSSGTEIIDGHVFDTLVIQKPLGTFYPGLATEWSVNDDATEYTFTLRDDVTFHDGTPFNADAVKFTFDRIVDPDLNSQMAFSFLGGTNYSETEVVDDYTVVVRFNQPNAAFMDSVTHPQLGPVSPTAVMELGSNFGITGLVGTGPFMFESYTPESEVVLVRNPDYAWGNEDVYGRTGPPDLERITWKLIQENSTRVASLESGEVDFIDAVPPLDIARLQDDPNVEVLIADQPGHGWSLMFNAENPPTDELAVRKAVAMAVDKEAMVDVVFNGYGSVACSALTKVMFGYDPDTCDYLPYNPEEAGNILEEAGWVMNEETGIRERDGEPLVLHHYYRAGAEPGDSIAPFVREDLAAIGIDFVLHGETRQGYFDAVRAGQHNTQNWWDTQTDPDGVMRTLFHSSNADGGTNRNRYRNEEMDMMIDAAVGVADPEARAAAYAEIQRKVGDEVIMMFFQDPVVVFAHDPALSGIEIFGGGFSPKFYTAHFM